MKPMLEHSEPENQLNHFRHHALVIWKEHKKIHQYAQQINVDIVCNAYHDLRTQYIPV